MQRLQLPAITTLLLLITIIIISCSGKQNPDVEIQNEDPVDKKLTVICPDPKDPHTTYESKDTCDNLQYECFIGYPFKIDGCGCGCTADKPFPDGFDLRACKSDEDCQITYTIENQCCDQLCTASNVLNKEAITMMEAWKEKNCQQTICPVASCAPFGDTYAPHCVNNTCTTEVHKAPNNNLN